MKILPSYFFLVFMCLFSLAQGQELPKPIQKSLEQVAPEALKNHIAYLADDRMRGRLPGTPEFELAVQYVESQYKNLGLVPAGEGGAYRQKVIIRNARLVAEDSGLEYAMDGKSLPFEFGKDFTLQPDFNVPLNNIEAQLAFAGYGISAPKAGHDDYAGLDVKGKIVIVLSGTPPDKFSSTENAHLGRASTKVKMAFQHGAAGFISLPSPNIGAGPAGGMRQAPSVRAVVFPDGHVAGGSANPYPEIKVWGSLTWSGLGKLLGYPDKPAKELAAMVYNPSAPIQLPGMLRIRTKTTYEDIESYNVIGAIPGADPVLKNEYVVHTAHLDHVGVGRPINGDSIYNGAHDNASGVASLLEIARTYTGLKKALRPKRSILFVMVTAEEMGLLGSAYFAQQPTVPKDKIVANVNTDMPTILAPLLGIVPLGAEHSTLMEVVKKAAGYLDLEVMEDHMPQEVRFVRSDQYNFVLQGIPALHIKYGLKTADPNFDLDGLIKDFTQNHYHKPSDELNDSFNFEAGRTYVQLNFLISYLVATTAEKPQWNAESIFSRH